MSAALRICCLLLALAEIPNSVAEPEAKQIGVEAKLEDFPFIAHINTNYEANGNKFTLQCAGSYIKPMWILTAALCILNVTTKYKEKLDVDAIECRMGVTQADPESLKSVPAIKPRKVYENDQLTLTDSVKHNLGLIQLEKTFALSATVGTIEYPRLPRDIAGKELTTVGYSTVYLLVVTEVPAENMKLRKLTAKAWTEDQCKKGQSDGRICIGEPGGTAWTFDQGGPLIYDNTLIGVATHATRAIEDEGIFEDVNYHKAWLESTILNNMRGKKTAGSAQRPIRTVSVIYLNIALLYLKFM